MFIPQLFPAVRRIPDGDIGSFWDNAERITRIATYIAMRLDVVKKGVLAESRNLIKVAGYAHKWGKVNKTVSVEAKGVVISHVKPNERHPEPNIRIRKRIAEKTLLCGKRPSSQSKRLKTLA